MDNNIKPLISFIIPCYNAEKFIKRCLDKVLLINLNKEVIVINDGSTDNSLNLLKEYQDKIVLISLENNMGVSHARNLGIDVAQGKYIAFIDIDDYFELDMHKKMIDKIINEDSDICLCDNDIIEINGKKLRSKYTVNFGSISQQEVIKNYLIDRIFPAVWASVYKTNIVKQIKFNETLRIGEDILFALRYLLVSKKTSFLPEPLYHYVQNNESALHNIYNKIGDYRKILDLLSDYVKYLESNLYNEFTFFKLQMVYRPVHALSLAYKRKDKKRVIALIKSFNKNNDFKKIYLNKYSSRKLKLEFFVLHFFGVRFHLFIFPLYKLIRGCLRFKL